MSNNFHLQLYRGTTAQNDAYTGLSGEVTVDTTLSKLRLHDGSTAGGVEIGGMPVGSIIPYAGTTIPAGYLLCDGSAISRTTYSALFASIGTTYGEGDGNSTFNIPALSGGVFLEGCSLNYENFGKTVQPGLPNIVGHGYWIHSSQDSGYSGSFYINRNDGGDYNLNQNVTSNGKEDYSPVHFDASRVNSIYGNSTTVQPFSVYTYYCIKY